MKKILIIIGVLVLVGLGVYYFFFRNRGATSTTSPLAAVVGLNASCKYNDPDLCKFINGWKEVKYMTAQSTTTDKSGKKTENTFKSVGKDRSQIIGYEAGKENFNWITIAQDTYTKDLSDGKWFKTTAVKSDEDAVTKDYNYDFDTKAEATEDKTTYKKVGTEQCGAYTCFKYQVIDPANTDTTEYLYFDNKQYQLRKTRSEAKDGTITESTFDYAKISIDVPSPIKEGTPGPESFGLPSGAD